MTEAQIVDTVGEAIEVYGESKQIVKAIEEMAELTHALCRYLTDDLENHEDEVTEELADVIVMVMQLLIVFDGETVKAMIEQKVERLRARLDGIPTEGR